MIYSKTIMLTTKQIRQKYLDFFQSKGHAVMASALLIPDNDPTTLFTGSGMQPMVPYLLGQKHPLGTRIADSQKCFRSQDIDEVGDNRHTVFFEMLGNWSLGDYFKNEQIPWMWEFITKELNLDPKKLYFTCFKGNESLGIPKDEESAGLWQKQFASIGIDAKVGENPEVNGMGEGERIFYYDEKKNWWSRSGVPGNMPEGEPGGPDTEMFWDFGVELGQHAKSKYSSQPCHVNCDCGRFMEIGNNVFMQYKKTAAGFELLSQKNVDFGGGLERMAAAVNNDMDIFKIDLFDGMRQKLEDLSGKQYGAFEKETYAFRVVMDHLRAATFLVGDGVFPSNKDQGYYVRRLIRRSVRFAEWLGITENFTTKIVESVILQYEDAYPNLVEKKDSILDGVSKEEEKFRRTLSQGLKIFREKTATLSEGQTISTEDAFDLYQSYGFPIELTEDLARENGLILDRLAFDAKRKEHQELSRAGGEQKFHGGLADHSEISTRYHTATHLLHAVLLKILGPHALQRGSNITQERMRFDFPHPQKMTPEEIKLAEDLVNAAIAKDYPVSWAEMSFEEAKAKGAIGLFEDRYQPIVKVYTMGDINEKAVADPSSPTFSREVCGGPHVEHTGLVGKFKIVKEEAVSAGMRRIKAIIE
ncbi:MAG: hypothetical protein A2563_01405 [Candidatus Magasanikbacteria bacterium RIFOXYD1_FULL_40_23]|uniref:alanine--tRNA ligase n=1 Tax=Candidatus Magasanikbacteria bacterium RIFOXYD1_FULL_40_23 TaxID=1798705 RepID=A0A1F6PAR2_9BACT|nr:MAG: hypothetical protein A2563_01405 [Candidatus Magasanikbacteria bacterium RIFOXYD1_FULL_40_23]